MAVRKPDAVLYVPSGASAIANTQKAAAEFGPTLGERQCTWRQLMIGNQALVTPKSHGFPPLLYPEDHPNPKGERYLWFVGEKGPDGIYVPVMEATGAEHEAGKVKLGYLKDDPHTLSPEESKAKAVADYDAAKKAAATDPEFNAKLASLGVTNSAAQ